MSRLVLKRASHPAVATTCSPTTKVVGRLYEDAHRSTPPELRWFWSTPVMPAVPNRTNGHAATLEDSGVGEG
jgi:hypothetical protein